MRFSRREFLISTGAALASSALQAAPPVLAKPTSAQLAWQREELALFVHFGINTFTDREWGDGREDPALFNPSALDARQWAHAARAAGARALILTAKHHDGFCLFPSATTQHSVAASPWHGGNGDVVREFTDACRAEGLRAGLYCSPWDRNSRLYGTAQYNDFYCAQLTELLTRYGEISEVWFDGANGEGPGGRQQKYDWPRTFALVRKLQPAAVIFSDSGPDARWCGNEKGSAGDPNWSPIVSAAVAEPGASGTGVISALQHGNPHGDVWRPAEVDVSIRPGWFHHELEDTQIKSVDALMAIWFSSVGRNAKLLLNVPPTRAGLMHDADVVRLREWRGARERLSAVDLAAGRRIDWHATGRNQTSAEIDFGRVVRADVARLEEPIEQGQRVMRYALFGARADDWRPLSRGSTIGCCKLDRFAPTMLRKLRLVVEDALAPPLPLRISLYDGGTSA